MTGELRYFIAIEGEDLKLSASAVGEDWPEDVVRAGILDRCGRVDRPQNEPRGIVAESVIQGSVQREETAIALFPVFAVKYGEQGRVRMVFLCY